MKRTPERLIALIPTILLLIFSLPPSLWAYSTQAVYDYAWQYKNQINPFYADYRGDPVNHEDANFVSQALIAGGLLNSHNRPPGVPLDAHGCITTREALADFLKNYEHAQAVGFKIDSFVPTSLAYGDVVFFGDDANPYKRVGVVVGYNAVLDDFDISFHDNSTGGSVGSTKTLQELTLVFGGATFYHIPKPEQVPEDQRFYGGNGFFGPGVLSVEVLRPGKSYLGYIVNNNNRLEQDMAIATDTSNPGVYKGCSYLISGYCCDPVKDVPSLGQTFGQPWTSDSPDHWAYWVRQAVIYGTEHNFESWSILNAVWYIVDRTGNVYGYDIINAIGYTQDGPTKKELVYLPLILATGISATADTPASQKIPPVQAAPQQVQKDFGKAFQRKMNHWKEKTATEFGDVKRDGERQ